MDRASCANNGAKAEPRRASRTARRQFPRSASRSVEKPSDVLVLIAKCCAWRRLDAIRSNSPARAPTRPSRGGPAAAFSASELSARSANRPIRALALPGGCMNHSKAGDQRCADKPGIAERDRAPADVKNIEITGK